MKPFEARRLELEQTAPHPHVASIQRLAETRERRDRARAEEMSRDRGRPVERPVDPKEEIERQKQLEWQFRDSGMRPRAYLDPARERDNIDVPVWGDTDEYRTQARALMAELIERHKQIGPETNQYHQDYIRRQRDAQQMVKLAEAAGVEIDADIKAQAETPSKQEQVDRINAEIMRGRQAALREKPPQPVNDGTLGRVLANYWG